MSADPKDSQERRSSPPAELPAELLAAYEATDYRVDASTFGIDTQVIRIGPHGVAAAAALLRALDARTAYILTAWNPFSVRAQDEENHGRQRQLVQFLEERGYRWLPAKGVARSGDWPAEESLCVLDIERQHVLELLVHFEQNAGVEVTAAGARLVLHPAPAKPGS